MAAGTEDNKKDPEQDSQDSRSNRDASGRETQDPIIARLQDQFGEDIVNAYESYGMRTVTVNRDRFFEVMQFLKENPETDFNFLTDECGIHYPDNAGQELGVICHLHNFIKNQRLRVETFFSSEDPHVASLTPLWSAANWMERETFDFFGIKFDGHPDLRVILNMEELGYHPMLKQYPLEDGTREDKNDKMFGR